MKPWEVQKELKLLDKNWSTPEALSHLREFHRGLRQYVEDLLQRNSTLPLNEDQYLMGVTLSNDLVDQFFGQGVSSMLAKAFPELELAWRSKAQTAWDITGKEHPKVAIWLWNYYPKEYARLLMIAKNQVSLTKGELDQNIHSLLIKYADQAFAKGDNILDYLSELPVDKTLQESAAIPIIANLRLGDGGQSLLVSFSVRDATLLRTYNRSELLLDVSKAAGTLIGYKFMEKFTPSVLDWPDQRPAKNGQDPRKVVIVDIQEQLLESKSSMTHQ